MRSTILAFATILISLGVQAKGLSDKDKVIELGRANGFKVSGRVAKAVVLAGHKYGIDVLELAAIGIAETGLGRYSSVNKNRNGTLDKGIFQINTVNEAKCVEYNLNVPEGSAMCAAKLLFLLKKKRSDYLGAYHSKTPVKKAKYINKLNKVLVALENNS